MTDEYGRLFDRLQDARERLKEARQRLREIERDEEARRRTAYDSGKRVARKHVLELFTAWWEQHVSDINAGAEDAFLAIVQALREPPAPTPFWFRWRPQERGWYWWRAKPDAVHVSLAEMGSANTVLLAAVPGVRAISWALDNLIHEYPACEWQRVRGPEP